MSFLKTVGKGFAWTTAGVVVGKIVVLGNVFLILYHLSVYEYGLTELVFSVVSTIGLFLLPGLGATITADLGVERARMAYGRMKAIFSEFFLINLALGFCAWALLFFGSTLVAELTGNMLIDKFFKIVSFTFLISPFRNATAMLATAALRYADQSFLGPVEEIAKGALLVLFLVVLEHGAAGLLLSSVLAPLVATLVFVPRTLSVYREFSRAESEGWQPLWNILREHRKWNVASAYVATLGQNIRLWIIKLLLGTEAVGLYAFAAGIYSHVVSVSNLQPVLTPLVPRYVDRPALLGRIMAASMKYQLVLSLAAGIAGAFMAFLLTTYIFPHYASSLVVVFVMMFALIPHGIAANLSPTFMALREQRSLFASIVIRVLAMAFFLPICVFFGGLTGIGVEYVLTMIVTSTERLYRMRRLLPEFFFSRQTLAISDEMEMQHVRAALRWSGLQRIFNRGNR